jgi:hypothetical protein
MTEEASSLLLDKASQGLGFMKLMRYVITILFWFFSLILFFIFKWFDRQKAYLDSLESQLRGLVKAIDLAAKHRSGVLFFKKIFKKQIWTPESSFTEIAVCCGEFAQTISDLSSADVGKQLSQSLAGLMEVERKAQDFQSVQSEQDMSTLMATGLFSFSFLIGCC